MLGWDGVVGFVEAHVEVVNAAGAEAIGAAVYCWRLEIEGNGHGEVTGVAGARRVGRCAGVFEGIEGDAERLAGAAESAGRAVGHFETDGAEFASGIGEGEEDVDGAVEFGVVLVDIFAVAGLEVVPSSDGPQGALQESPLLFSGCVGDLHFSFVAGDEVYGVE